MATSGTKHDGFGLSVDSLYRSFVTCPFLLILLVLVSTDQRACGQAINDSTVVKHYQRVSAFDGKVQFDIPERFQKLKNKELKEPCPFTSVDRIGYKYKNGTTLRFYLTQELYPEKRTGIEIWDVLIRLSTCARKEQEIESGYFVVNKKKWGSRKDLYFVKILVLNSRDKPEYALIFCVELRDRMFVGFIDAPKLEYIEAFEEDFYDSMILN